MWNEECGMMNAECGMLNEECGISPKSRSLAVSQSCSPAVSSSLCVTARNEAV